MTGVSDMPPLVRPEARAIVFSRREAGFWSNGAGWVYDAKSATVLSVDDALAIAERLAQIIPDARIALAGDGVRRLVFDDGPVALLDPPHRLRLGMEERALRSAASTRYT